MCLLAFSSPYFYQAIWLSLSRWERIAACNLAENGTILTKIPAYLRHQNLPRQITTSALLGRLVVVNSSYPKHPYS